MSVSLSVIQSVELEQLILSQLHLVLRKHKQRVKISSKILSVHFINALTFAGQQLTGDDTTLLVADSNVILPEVIGLIKIDLLVLYLLLFSLEMRITIL